MLVYGTCIPERANFVTTILAYLKNMSNQKTKDQELILKIIELYQKAATELPADIVLALKKYKKNEDHSRARNILNKIIENCEKAKKEKKPICQDTGTPIFYIKYPAGKYTQTALKKIINKATQIATKKIPMRDNTVEALSGEAVKNTPIIHFEETRGKKLKIDLMLKGGGSENVSVIYNLPYHKIKAKRNLDGVRKCVLYAISKAQGKGCPPYIIGAGIGRSIEEVFDLAKRQLLRKINDKNSHPELAKLEEKTLKEVNEMGIGPIGLGGKTTAIAVKAASGLRHPASYVVGISIGCWALRRQRIEI